MVTDNVVGSTLEEFFTVTQPINSLYKSLSNNLYGISNNNNSSSYTPYSVDNYGLAFFTRPQLNLNKYNLRNEQSLYSFLTTNPKSVHTYIRNMLDPRLQNDPTNGIKCPLLDNQMAYIPVLTNNLISMSGWPDVVLPTYTTDEGIRREQWAIGDGYIDVFNAWDLDCTFRNVQDEPIMLLIKLWTTYISKVFEGVLSPYSDFIINNEIDYNTRIYRLVLDSTKKYVKKIAATGASFPVNLPTGKFFDYTKSETYNLDNKDVNIRFQCLGANYMEDILVKEFNETTGIFHGEMRKLNRYIECEDGIRPGDKKENYEHTMTKVPFELLTLFNYRSYPYINPRTLELEWYADRTTKFYQYVISKLTGKTTINIPDSINRNNNIKLSGSAGLNKYEAEIRDDDSSVTSDIENKEYNPFEDPHSSVKDREEYVRNIVDEQFKNNNGPFVLNNQEVNKADYIKAYYLNVYKNMAINYNQQYPNNGGSTIPSDYEDDVLLEDEGTDIVHDDNYGDRGLEKEFNKKYGYPDDNIVDKENVSETELEEYAYRYAKAELKLIKENYTTTDLTDENGNDLTDDEFIARKTKEIYAEAADKIMEKRENKYKEDLEKMNKGEINSASLTHISHELNSEDLKRISKDIEKKDYENFINNMSYDKRGLAFDPKYKQPTFRPHPEMTKKDIEDFVKAKINYQIEQAREDIRKGIKRTFKINNKYVTPEEYYRQPLIIAREQDILERKQKIYYPKGLKDE